MTATVILLWAVLGGLWRREFGRCVILGKTALKLLALPLCAPVGLLFPLYLWPYAVLAVLGLWLALLAFITMSMYPGGRFSDDREVMLKYGPFALGYVLAHRFWRDEWNTDYLNGADPVGECFLGASVFGCAGAVWLWII